MLNFFAPNPKHPPRKARVRRGIAYGCAFFLMLFSVNIQPRGAHAQFFNDEYSSDVFEDSELYFEASTEGGIENDSVPGQDITEGNLFVEEIPGSVQSENGTRLLSPEDIRLAAERDNFPANLGWGGGLGLLMGGWFALISRGNNRTSLRALGLGTVLGISLGALMGLRSLILPDAPRPSLGKGSPSQHNTRAPMLQISLQHGMPAHKSLPSTQPARGAHPTTRWQPIAPPLRLQVRFIF